MTSIPEVMHAGSDIYQVESEGVWGLKLSLLYTVRRRRPVSAAMETKLSAAVKARTRTAAASPLLNT